jgi:hypothetical protein
MAATLDALILDLLEWVARAPRDYTDVMDAWRTSCPRLPVWEDAVDRGFLVRDRTANGLRVCVTDRGRDFLAASGRRVAAAAC